MRFPADRQLPYDRASGDDTPNYSATVRNISAGGINIVVDREFKPGDLISVQLPAVNGHGPTMVLGLRGACKTRR